MELLVILTLPSINKNVTLKKSSSEADGEMSDNNYDKVLTDNTIIVQGIPSHEGR